MKRNNLFMLAYIIFIFAACWIKPFWEYSMWNKFVAAVTVTSFFLTISDLLYSLIRTSDEIMKFELRYISEVEPEFKLMKKSLEDYLKKGLAKDKDCITNNVKILEQSFEAIRAYSNEIFERSKKCKNVANIITVLGFFSFFLIFAVEQITSLIISGLDSITISAFGFVLLTQYLGEEKQNDLFKDIEKCVEHKNAIIALRKSYQQEVLHNAD